MVRYDNNTNNNNNNNNNNEAPTYSFLCLDMVIELPLQWQAGYSQLCGRYMDWSLLV